MKKSIFLLVFMVACGVRVARAQLPMPSCGSTGDILLRTFLPQLTQNPSSDVAKLLSGYEDYPNFLRARDENILSKQLGRVRPSPQMILSEYQLQRVQFNLEKALTEFYEVGAQLYGVQLNPRLIISPSDELNAFATGATVVINEGLVAYYLAPQSLLLAEVASRQGGRYTLEQYNWAQQQFPWQGDWTSLYFILAHEASHNLMRHPDRKILQTGVGKLLARYTEQVRNERHDIAYGKVGFGTKFSRFLLGSLESFERLLGDPEQQREQESEADAIALVLLKQTGWNPDAGPTALEHLGALLGEGVPSGGFLRQALCSDHPATSERVSHLRVELACVRSGGNLCEQHVTFAIEQFVHTYQEKITALQEYQRETHEVAATAPNDSSPTFLVKIEVKPKDADLTIDGKPIQSGWIKLREGPHQVNVSREGYRAETRQVVVYPDIQIKIKLGVKKEK